MSRFTTVFEQRGKCWLGFAEEIPGANSQGSSLDEARTNLEKAVRHIVENNRDYVRRETGGRSVIREEMIVDC